MILSCKGDEGSSINPNDSSQRIAKCADIFNVLGELDELVAVMGIAKEYVGELWIDRYNELQSIAEEGETFVYPMPKKVSQAKNVGETLENLQNSLINVSFFISTYYAPDRETIDPSKDLKKSLRTMESEMRSFEDNGSKGLYLVIASGGKASTHLYHARSVCRRFERTLLKFLTNQPTGPLYMTIPHISSVLAFVNRLGDYLFSSAKILANESEIHYSP